jgi:hypothetical protein
MPIPENLKPCKTEKVCDDADATIYPIMKHLVEVDKMSEHKAGDETEIIYDGNVTSDQARMIYRRRKPGTRVPVVKPLKKRTKKEVKIPLAVITEAVKNDEIADADLKLFEDVVSMKVAAGKISTTVTARLAGAHDTKSKSKRPPRNKPKKGLVEKVTEAFTMMQYNLESVLGKGKQSIKPGERKMLTTAFMHGLPNFLRTLIWMGIDIDEALKRAKAQHQKELESGKNRKNHPRLEE